MDLIQSGKYQPRRAFEPESLRELADSIIAQGLMQPIVVRPMSPIKNTKLLPVNDAGGPRSWLA